MSLAALTDRACRELYAKGDEDARRELIKRGLIGCPRMEREAAKSRRRAWR